MPLYHDPKDATGKPSLIGGLIQSAQLENRATEALAWLIDNSLEIAQAVVELIDAYGRQCAATELKGSANCGMSTSR